MLSPQSCFSWTECRLPLASCEGARPELQVLSSFSDAVPGAAEDLDGAELGGTIFWSHYDGGR